MQMSIKQIFLLLLKKNTLSLHKNRLNLLNFCEFQRIHYFVVVLNLELYVQYSLFAHCMKMSHSYIVHKSQISKVSILFNYLSLFLRICLFICSEFDYLMLMLEGLCKTRLRLSRVRGRKIEENRNSWWTQQYNKLPYRERRGE